MTKLMEQDIMSPAGGLVLKASCLAPIVDEPSSLNELGIRILKASGLSIKLCA